MQPAPTRMHIDWIRCEARGACLELLPELLRPDDWGYPVAPRRPGERDLAVPVELQEYARRAVDACPRLALSLRPTTG